MDTILDRILTTDFLHLSIPFFFLFILLEIAYSWIKHKHWYRLNDTINSLTCGAISQIFHVMTMPGLLFVYAWIESNFGLFPFEYFHGAAKWGTVIILFIAADFFYYWFHRVAHRVNIGWATHIVHHQSEEYNLSTALRQGIFQHFISFWFYLPLAFLGFPLLWFIAMSSLVSLYQVWLHTQSIRKLPYWFEYIFNTPSHHRVHHAMQRQYLDKNYAGTLIIWDRIFGTFVAETETPQYGTTVPLRSWHPLIAQIDYFRWIINAMKLTPGLKNKMGYLWKRPGWHPADVKLPQPSFHAWDRYYQKYNPEISPYQKILALILFLVAFLLTLQILFDENLSQSAKIAIYGVSLFVFTFSGKILEDRYDTDSRVDHTTRHS